MRIVITCQEPIGGTPLNTDTILAKVAAALWPSLAATSIAIEPELPAPLPLGDERGGAA
jgi:hypothetical protein